MVKTYERLPVDRVPALDDRVRTAEGEYKLFGAWTLDDLRSGLELLDACSGCGCTDEEPCPGGCFWVEPGLCSRCA